MSSLLYSIARSFARAFGGSLLILAPGVLAAPNFNGAVALGLAAFIAALAAGLRAIQVFVPKLSFQAYIPGVLGGYVDSFARAFLGAFITAIVGVLAMPDLSSWRAAATAALIGAVTAGIRAVEGLVTPGQSPKPSAGIQVPPSPHAD